MDAVVAKYFTADDFPTGALQVDIVVQGVFAGRQNSGPTWDLYRCKECAALTDTPEQHARWHETQVGTKSLSELTGVITPQDLLLCDDAGRHVLTTRHTKGVCPFEGE